MNCSELCDTDSRNRREPSTGFERGNSVVREQEAERGVGPEDVWERNKWGGPNLYIVDVGNGVFRNFGLKYKRDIRVEDLNRVGPAHRNSDKVKRA